MFLVAVTLRAATGRSVVPASNSDPRGRVGKRPYELDWAGRDRPAHPQLVDFEDLTGWQVVGLRGCRAEAFRSREELLFGSHTAKVVYRGETAASAFELRPPEPIPIPGRPTDVALWVRGNNWGWHSRPRTARTHVYVLLEDARGEAFSVNMGTVNFDYWFLMHATMIGPAGQQTSRVRKTGSGDGKLDYPLRFLGIRVTSCSDPKPARLFFDALQFYRPAYEPLPEMKLPPADTPWPTTPETITPPVKSRVAVRVRQRGEGWEFVARSRGETLRWRYEPRTGWLDDLSVEIRGREFRPCARGGPALLLGGQERRPGDKAVQTRLVAARRDGDSVAFEWEAKAGGGKARYSYRLRAVGKSLQVEAQAAEATAFLVGHAAPVPGAELIRVPYLTLGWLGPYVVHWNGLFLSGLLDWYNSDASELFAAGGRAAGDGLTYNGGSRYLPRTDGQRNPLRERLIVTVSSDFQEVLPHIPHPRNPMAHLATGAIWRNIGAPNRDLLLDLKARGVERFICPLHEVGWRDAGESFTFRLRCAPRIGDDEMRRYGQWVKSLGYRFGLYANYTDYAPINANWEEEKVCRRPDGNWTGAWPRCYAPKPTYAWQAEARFAPGIAAKFGANTCYSDVHTAVTPWNRTDYDARVPGAGMFRATWRCYAWLLWNECKSYQGPVFSEGRMHWMYAGLVTGNYAQITGPQRWRVPPLVDFDLLRLHPLETDFGMGMPSMFFPRHEPTWRRDRSRTSPYLDRFITSTLAFGHIGFLPLEWGLDGALKAFYLTNALQQRYALVEAEAIRYFDGRRLLTTSQAIRAGAHKRGQVFVRYRNGLRLWCNLSFRDDWPVRCNGRTYVLPPTGHLAWRPGDLFQCSAIVDGHRREWVEAPEYFYLDTRDRFAVRGPLACRGAVALKPLAGREAWLAIPLTECEDLAVRPSALGLGRDVALAATALDREGKPLGEAEVRVSNIGHAVMPVEGAVAYRLEAMGRTVAPAFDAAPRLVVPRVVYTPTVEVVNLADETLREARYEVRGPSGRLTASGQLPAIGPGRRVRVPVNLWVRDGARAGERVWFRLGVWGRVGERRAEGVGWFTALVAPPLEATLAPATTEPLLPGATTRLLLRLRSNLPGESKVRASFDAPWLELRPTTIELSVGEGSEEVVALEVAVPEREMETPVEAAFDLPSGREELRWLVATSRERLVAAGLSQMAPRRTGIAFRGKGEEPLRPESGASFYAARRTVGGISKAGFFCHPPYRGGVGYAFGEFELKLPDEPCLFEAQVGFVDGSSTTDGCVFSVQVREKDARTFTTIASTQFAALRKWKVLRGDLAPFEGKTVVLRVVTDVGPAGDSNSDWAFWGEPRVIAARERMRLAVREARR